MPFRAMRNGFFISTNKTRGFHLRNLLGGVCRCGNQSGDADGCEEECPSPVEHRPVVVRAEEHAQRDRSTAGKEDQRGFHRVEGSQHHGDAAHDLEKTGPECARGFIKSSSSRRMVGLTSRPWASWPNTEQQPLPQQGSHLELADFRLARCCSGHIALSANYPNSTQFQPSRQRPDKT
jgi:hypothetical protein